MLFIRLKLKSIEFKFFKLASMVSSKVSIRLLNKLRFNNFGNDLKNIGSIVLIKLVDKFNSTNAFSSILFLLVSVLISFLPQVKVFHAENKIFKLIIPLKNFDSIELILLFDRCKKVKNFNSENMLFFK